MLNSRINDINAAEQRIPLKRGHVAYLCLQATREGQASHAHVHEIAEGLRADNWQVTLFEPAYAKEKHSPGFLGRLLEFWRIQLKLWNSPGPYDALYIRAHYAAWPTAVWARYKGLPVLQELNGPYEDLFIAWPATRRFASFFAYLMRSQLRWANATITVTPQLGTWLRQETDNRPVYVIPNGANTTLFSPDSTLVEPLPTPYVVFFGALAPWQGLDTLLAAVRHPEWPVGLTAVICGDGVERPKVEAAAQELTHLVYLGPKPYKEMGGIIANSIAGLSPKNNQGDRAATGLSPLKVYETLACGVPIVVTDFPGQADLIRETGCGKVVPAEDPAALARAVAELYQDPESAKELGRKARTLVESFHSWRARAKDTSEAIEQAIRG